MNHRRNRTKQTLSFAERLTKAAEEARAKARALEPGKERDLLIDKARQFEAQVDINALLETRGSSLS